MIIPDEEVADLKTWIVKKLEPMYVTLATDCRATWLVKLQSDRDAALMQIRMCWLTTSSLLFAQMRPTKY